MDNKTVSLAFVSVLLLSVTLGAFLIAPVAAPAIILTPIGTVITVLSNEIFTLAFKMRFDEADPGYFIVTFLWDSNETDPNAPYLNFTYEEFIAQFTDGTNFSGPIDVRYEKLVPYNMTEKNYYKYVVQVIETYGESYNGEFWVNVTMRAAGVMNGFYIPHAEGDQNITIAQVRCLEFSTTDVGPGNCTISVGPTVADSFRFPLDGAWTVSRGFGKWYDDFQGYHMGEDVLRDFEAPVYAPANGVVKHNANRTDYGYVVIIEHELMDGTFVCSVLGHLREEGRAQVGSTVTKGQIVGYLSSLEPIHLHFGIRKGIYSTEPDRDGKWRYRGYGPADIVDHWYPPSDFINYYNLQKTTTLPKEIGLTVKVASDKASYTVGEKIRFAATVTNPTNETGINITAHNVTLTINPPAEIELETPETYYQLGDINPGESKTITFNATATKAGSNVMTEVKAAGEDHVLGTSLSGREIYTFSIIDPATPKPDWSFAIITDFHIGYEFRSAPDYDGSETDITRLARRALNRILNEKDNYNITFVVVLGDLSDMARESEFKKAREILRVLNDPNGDNNTEDGIPYIPLIGNHDMRAGWIYASTDLFNVTFWGEENKMNVELIEERLENFMRQDVNNYEYQNYFFRYEGINFVCLDLQFRKPWKLARSSYGTYHDATRDWVRQFLKEHVGEEFIFLSHVPLSTPLPYDIDFRIDNLDTFVEDLYSHDVLFTINFAGHTHRNIETYQFKKIWYRVVETESAAQVPFDRPFEWMPTYTRNVIRIVQVKNGQVNHSTTLTYMNYPDVLLWPSPFFTHTFASHPEPNKPVVFTAYINMFHGFETSFHWDFGDGNSGTGLTVEHVYSQEGDYNVTLTVIMKNLLTGDETVETVTNTIYVRNKHIISALPAGIYAICGKTGEDLTKVPKNTYELAIIMKGAVDEVSIAKFWINFEEADSDIDFSSLVADVDLTERKSIVYMPSWSAEVEEYKQLFIPSIGAGSVYIVLNATSLDEVSIENADLIINVGETINNITVTTTSYNGREYYLVSGVSGTGGGEFVDVTVDSIALYEMKIDVNETFNVGTNLSIRFYSYAGEFQAESTIWNGTTPAYMLLSENISHPLNWPIEIATLVFTDKLGNRTYTLTTFIMSRSHLMARLAKLDENWLYASSEQRSAIFKEIVDIDAQWPYAPT